MADKKLETALPPTMSFEQIEKEFIKTPELKKAYEERTAAAEAAEMIHTMRGLAELTQKELAEMIGTKQPMIARLEKTVPKLGPTFETLARISKACGFKMTVRFEKMSESERAENMAPVIATEFPDSTTADDDR